MASGDKGSATPSRSFSFTFLPRHLSAVNTLHLLSTLGLFALIWFLLTGHEWQSWLIGAPVAVMAAWSTLQLRSSAEGRLNLSGLLKFLPYFIRESVLGGIDVASRVMRPKMRIAPGFLTYRMRLTQPPARRLFVNSLSLLPGTLTADLDGASVYIHALDRHLDLSDELRRLEQMVSAVYGESL